MTPATDWTDILLSVPAYALWLGPLLVAVGWGLWKLVHQSHPSDQTVADAARRPAPRVGATPPLTPLAHG